MQDHSDDSPSGHHGADYMTQLVNRLHGQPRESNKRADEYDLIDSFHRLLKGSRAHERP
jgi:hypothetical protein